ncbi:MAG: hypothetical protein J7L10_05265 [Methanomicrobia archaeon]|nr:hypothetical protein [Methanomicrobia archaeon]HDN81102.1 hypothetical protein [Methanomicrobia archaeon]
MKLYICESCGYNVCAEKAPKRCPNCRSRFLEKGECEKDFVKVTCPECEEVFYYDPKKGKPFKCAFCDHTFAEVDYF